MANYHLNKFEQETHIRYDAAGEAAYVYTANPLEMNRLDKLCAAYPDVYSYRSADTLGGRVIAKSYIVNKKYVSFRKPPSEKQREAARRNGVKSRFNGFSAANSPQQTT